MECSKLDAEQKGSVPVNKEETVFQFPFLGVTRLLQIFNESLEKKENSKQVCYQYFCCYCVVQVWFSWMVLNIESIFEEDSQLRRVVEGELIINDLSPDQALKVRELFILYS